MASVLWPGGAGGGAVTGPGSGSTGTSVKSSLSGSPGAGAAPPVTDDAVCSPAREANGGRSNSPGTTISWSFAGMSPGRALRSARTPKFSPRPVSQSATFHSVSCDDCRRPAPARWIQFPSRGPSSGKRSRITLTLYASFSDA